MMYAKRSEQVRESRSKNCQYSVRMVDMRDSRPADSLPITTFTFWLPLRAWARLFLACCRKARSELRGKAMEQDNPRDTDHRQLTMNIEM